MRRQSSWKRDCYSRLNQGKLLLDCGCRQRNLHVHLALREPSVTRGSHPPPTRVYTLCTYASASSHVRVSVSAAVGCGAFPSRCAARARGLLSVGPRPNAPPARVTSGVPAVVRSVLALLGLNTGRVLPRARAHNARARMGALTPQQHRARMGASWEGVTSGTAQQPTAPPQARAPPQASRRRALRLPSQPPRPARPSAAGSTPPPAPTHPAATAAAPTAGQTTVARHASARRPRRPRRPRSRTSFRMSASPVSTTRVSNRNWSNSVSFT